MKKILYSVLLLFLFLGKIKAGEIYYSDYSAFSDFQEERIESSELVNVEEEIRYRFFTIDSSGNKKYSDIYSKEALADYPNKEESQYKIYYRYQTRDKLIVDADKEIREKNFNLHQLVLEITKPYTIEENINWDKNGLYLVTFKTENMEVTIRVILSIPENKIREYQQEIEELKEEINFWQQALIQKDQDYGITQDLLQGQIDYLEEQLRLCHSGCEEEKNCLIELLNQKSKEIEEYQDFIYELSDEVNSLQVEKQQLLEEVLLYQKEYQDQESTVIALQNQLDNLLKEMKTLNQTLTEFYQKQEELKQSYQAQIQVLENQIKEQEAQTNLLNEEKQDLQSKIIHLKHQIEAYTDKIKELDHQNHGLNTTIGQVIQEKEKKIGLYEERIQELEKQLKKQIVECTKEQTDIQEMKQLKKFNPNPYTLTIYGNNQTKVVIFCIVLIFIFLLLMLWMRRKRRK